MQQSFEYLKVQTAMDSITVPDIGNCILEAVNDTDFHWYLSIQTELGMTTIKEFGPMFRSEEVARNLISYNAERKEYNEKNIGKRISNFINDSRRQITQVFEIEEIDFLEKLDELKSLL